MFLKYECPKDKIEYQIVENISIEKNGKYKPIKFHEEELV